MILERLSERYPSEVLETGKGQGDLFAVVRTERSHEILSWLRNDPEMHFDLLVDLCGVDRSGLGSAPRLEVVYHLFSFTHHHRLRLRVRVSEESGQVATVTDLWKSADWMERECWEMFGIVFGGHPNLKHLLLFEGFEGYPLRKDYPIEKRQKIPIPEETPP